MKHIDDQQQILGQILDYTAVALDISEELDQRLTASYADLGAWLKQDDEDRYRADSEVYPQGSRLLGTLTAPVNPRDDCDVDAVYRRNLKRESVTQQELKAAAGEQLARYVMHARQRGIEAPRLEEKSRCWTLHYRGFHLDILPALPDDQAASAPARATESIIITDRNVRRWQSSNPKGYAGWFRTRMAEAMQRERVKMARAARVDVEQIPENSIKTPLQRAIQLLKRHRDVTYQGDPDDKPISIIITTLAAEAYQDQENIYSTLLSLVLRMPGFVRNRNGVLWVPNPTNPNENFADKWALHPQRARTFFDWLGGVQADLADASNQQGLDRIATTLARAWGKFPASEGVRRYGESVRAQRASGGLRVGHAGALGSTGATIVPNHTFFGRD